MRVRGRSGGGASRALARPTLAATVMAAPPLPPDLAALRAYVTAPGAPGGAARAPSTVLLHVDHASLSHRFAELRLDMHVSARVGAVTGDRGGAGAEARDRCPPASPLPSFR